MDALRAGRHARGGPRRHRRSTRGSSTSSCLINEVAQRSSTARRADARAAAPGQAARLLRRAARPDPRHEGGRRPRRPARARACARSTRRSTPARPSSPRRTPYHYSSYDEETEVAPREQAAVIILGSGPEPDRPGHRVRLLLRARQPGAARGGLRDRHGQLQPRDGLDRLRHLRPALLRAAHARGRARDRARRDAGRPGRRRDLPARRPDAARPGPGARGRRRADRRHLARRRSTWPRSAARSAGCSPRPG